MALERQEEFFKEISETALKEMNIDDLTKQLTSDYNKDYYAGMATIRQSIKDTLQPIFKSLSNYNVYQMALYTCHTTKPTLIDKFFDELSKTKDKKERTILYAKIAICQFCDDECARREGRMTYEEFMQKNKGNKILRELEKDNRQLDRIEKVEKKDHKKGMGLFAKWLSKKAKKQEKTKTKNTEETF